LEQIYGTKKKSLLRHFAVWAVYVSFNFLVQKIAFGATGEQLTTLFLDTIAKYAIAISIFYSNTLLILPFLWSKRKYVMALILSLACLVFFFGLKEIIYRRILPLFGYPEVNISLFDSFVMHSWWWFQYTIFGFGFWFAKDAVKKERQIRHLETERFIKEQQRTQLEKEKIIAEHAYLKAQISPHLFYNVLNFLYAKSLKASKELSDGILILSDFMRYAFTKNENEKGEVPLDKEIEHLENIININQLRFDHKLKVQFSTYGDFKNTRILSFILATLVENVFKHGDLLDKGDPVVIRLEYNCISRIFTFYTKNKKKKRHNSAPVKPGIGIENIRKRLNYCYPALFDFETMESDDHYITNLKIFLQND
jgi:two-component system LytT family sensor kinase